MEDFYKQRYEETSKQLRKKEREASFYRNLVWMICGVTNGITLVLFWFLTSSAVVYLVKNWVSLTVSDKVAVSLAVFAVIGGVIQYGKKVLNWPEELYLYSLRKEKEVNDLTKD